MPVAKKDVEKLTGDELTSLVGFAKSAEYKILERLAQESKTRRAFEGLYVSEIKDLAILNGMNLGTDFIMDAVNRAREELKRRGDNTIDNDEDIK